jgi:O-antigen/teichoic acid export membrane protein
VAVANEAVPIVFGEKWSRAVIPLQIIVGFTLIRSFVSPCGQIVNVMGRPRVEFLFNLVQAPIAFGAVLIGAQYGIIGVSIAMSLPVGLMALGFLKLSVGLIDLPLKNIFRVITPALVSSLVMLGVVASVRFALIKFGYNNYYILLICVPLGVVVYFGTLLTCFKSSFRMLWNIFMDTVGNRLTGTKKVYPAFH